MARDSTKKRTKVFISKATPRDDSFALWLAPRLEAEGYEVFADILRLRPGDTWRLKITSTLQDETVKMLLCCSNETLQRDGVIEEIEIAKDLSRNIPDPNFIVPLRIEPFNKVFGIGSLQYIDFEQSWADGLTKLLTFLKEEAVPTSITPHVQHNWAGYLKRRSVTVRRDPETLTSNWLRVLSAPDLINLITPVGSIPMNMNAKKGMADAVGIPLVPYGEGFVTFGNASDFNQHSNGFGSFQLAASKGLDKFQDTGWEERGIGSIEANKTLMNLFRQAWELHCSDQQFTRWSFANSTAFFVSDKKASIAQRISWGRQGHRRNSMLRNIARKKVWEYGVMTHPSFLPFPHFKLKGSVLFSEANGKEKAATIEDNRAQHRLRRSVCSGWRNKAWHGRLMAFMELLAGDSPYVSLPVGMGQFIVLDAMPIQATSPVTARQRNKLGEDAEERDLSTIDGYFAEEEA